MNAAFAYWRPRERNRFNDAGFGAWYAAFEAQTAVAEVIDHIGRELERIRNWHAAVEWSEMWASFAGSYVDLRSVAPPPECLHPDVEVGYPPGNTLARETRDAGHNGIVYPSVRAPGGTCLVALWPHAVQSVTQGAIVRTAWSGSRIIPSARTPALAAGECYAAMTAGEGQKVAGEKPDRSAAKKATALATSSSWRAAGSVCA